MLTAIWREEVIKLPTHMHTDIGMLARSGLKAGR